MRNLLIPVFSLLLLLALAVAPLPASAADDELAALARRVVDQLQKKQAEPLFQMMDQTMQKAIGTPEKLNAIWDGLVTQCGAYKKQGPVRSLKYQQYDIRFVTTEFEKATLDTQIVFDAEKKISGLFFRPAQPVQTPLPSAAPAIRTVEVTVGTAPWELPGTLALPKGLGPFPALVLVHGSGPQDRDESIGANMPFRDLAEGLLAKGVAVLRYEKRTRRYAKAYAGDKPITVKEEVIDDALAAVNLLKKDSRIDPRRIFVAGHSLGGMLIPRIAEAVPDLAGLIVMAGPTRPLEDVVLEQASYLSTQPGAQDPAVQKHLEEMKQQVPLVKALKPGAPRPAASILGAPPEYWLSLKGYDPADSAKAMTRPLLIIQGGRDYHVTSVDYKRWQAALAGKPNVTFKFYPELNHLFIAGQGKSTPAEYNHPGRVAQPMIDDLAAWIAQIK